MQVSGSRPFIMVYLHKLKTNYLAAANTQWDKQNKLASYVQCTNQPHTLE